MSKKMGTVFLTGGSRGIGKAIKDVFIQNGYEVIAPSRQEMDLSSSESVRNYINFNKKLDIDIFIHCAGLNKIANLDEITVDIMKDVFQVNLFSAVELLKLLSVGMKQRKKGKVIFISSLYSIVSREGRLAYSSSKNALTGLCKTLALELAPFNIMVNAVAPGYVMTDMTKKNLTEQEIKNIERNIPTGRFQSEKEIADLTAFLCSEYNKSITGQLIAVDGGYICR